MSLSLTILSGLRPLVPASLIELGVKNYINRRYSAVGKVVALEIDSSARKVSLDFELNGEPGLLRVTVDCYELTEVDGQCFLEIKELHASRPWLNSLAPLLLDGKKLAVPPIARVVLGC